MAETLEGIGFGTGLTLYSILQNAAGNYFDPADNTFKAFVSAATHDIPMSADANQGQIYSASVATTNFGTSRQEMRWLIYQQAGGAPNLAADTVIGEDTLIWTGTAFVKDAANLVWNALRANFVIDGSFGRQGGLHYRVHDYQYNSVGAPIGFQVSYYSTAAQATAGGATGRLFIQTFSNLAWSAGVPSAAGISATA